MALVALRAKEAGAVFSTPSRLRAQGGISVFPPGCVLLTQVGVCLLMLIVHLSFVRGEEQKTKQNQNDDSENDQAFRADKESDQPGTEIVEIRAPRPTGLSSRPSALVSVVPAGERGTSVVTVPQLVREAPSVRIREFGGLGHLATVGLRGASPNQTLVLLDDVPISSSGSGGTDLSFLPAAFLDRVEILRGSASVLYGSGAMGGVVNLVTRAAGRARWWARLSGGSFGSWLSSAGSEFCSGRTDFLLAASGLVTAGDFPFRDDRGTPNNPADDFETRRENNRARTAALLIKSKTRFGGGSTLSFTHQSSVQERGVPGMLGFRSKDAYETSFLALLDLRTRIPLEEGLFEVSTRLQSNGHHLIDEAGQLTGVPLDSRQEFTDLVTFARVVLPWQEAHMVRLQAEAGQLALRDPAFGNPDRKKLALAASGDFSLVKDLLVLCPAVRLGYDSNVGLQLVPALGFAAGPFGGTVFRINLSRAYRLPDFNELYLRGGFAEGNPKLLPESAWGADLGVEWAGFQKWSVVVAGFYERYSNVIVFEPAGNFRYRPLNTGATDVGGLELEIGAPLAESLDLSAHYSLLLSADRSGRSNRSGNRLPGWPVHTAGLRLSGKWRKLLWEGELNYVGSNYVNAANTKELAARLLVDAGLGVDAGEGMVVMIQARNLSNTQVQDVRGFPLPGISFFLTVTFLKGDEQ